jgi:predicted ArsR family transcriptional regulator
MTNEAPTPDQKLHATSVVPPKARRREPTGQQAAILQVIKTGPMTSEEVAARTGIRAAGARLSELLRDGYVRSKRQNSTGKYVLIYEFVPNPQQRASLGMALKEQFADGKWHRLSHIADNIDHAEDRVRRTLDGMLKKQIYGCKAEKKKVGQHFEYRIFRLGKTVSSSELIEKLTPILKGLEAEGAKNMATMSPGTVAYLAGQLRRLLEEWTE